MTREPSYAPIIGPMRDGESRYRELPLLSRCRRCKSPVEEMQMWSVVRGGRVERGLCETCANRQDAPVCAQCGVALPTPESFYIDERDKVWDLCASCGRARR